MNTVKRLKTGEGVKQFRNPVINNIKISLRVKKEVNLYNTLLELDREREQLNNLFGAQIAVDDNIKRTNNFYVIRNKFVYTVFTSGFLNITKIKSFEDINKAIKRICSIYEIAECDISNYSMDNISANGSFGKKLNLIEVIKAVELSEGNFIPNYKPAYFPGATLKHFKCGSIIIFASGSFNIVGAKSREDIDTIFHQTLKIIEAL
jgi:TATA-box binding protein (TBP) (component of TFIID and TFIIIB)